MCDRETLQIASHVASVAELLEGNEDNFHVEFANDAIRIFQGIATGQVRESYIGGNRSVATILIIIINEAVSRVA